MKPQINVNINTVDAIPPTSNIDGDFTRRVRVYNRIKVKDTGCGIPESTLHRIFEPYYTTKEADAGTGMGLAVVHSIIENHQGWIDVESSYEGTQFCIYLPRAESKAKTEEELIYTKPDSSGGNECILIVDDNVEITKMLKRMLSKRGYTIISSANGNDALRMFASEPDKFDLVITDQTMPGKNGDELAAELIALKPEIPIILCTGYSDYLTAESAMELGIRKFMPKPVSNAELSEAIRSVLDNPVSNEIV